MTARQRELDRIRPGDSRAPKGKILLGDIADVRRRLPLDIELNGSRFKVAELDGRLIAYSTLCPHLLGPLADASVEDGIVECPWHGYRFDVRTRGCVSGAACKLAPAPEVRIDPSGSVIVEQS